MKWRGFASDNYAGIHPEVLDAIVRANDGHAIAYGEDDETLRLQDLVREHFGAQAQAFPVFNGTGANVVALQSICRPWEAVICTETAHVNVDEGGAPEKVAGLKLWTTPTVDGLLTPEAIDIHAVRFGDVHRAQQAVVTVTQSSELGTAYSVDQLGALVEHVHALGMKVHLDGARIANAAAGLGVPLRAITTDVGIDILSFGGTKNGAMGAEAVVVLNPALADAVPFLRKSSMQLASKMRFVSAQLCALLTDDLWRRNATHANGMAQRLRDGVQGIPGVEVQRQVDANAVFAILPRDVTARLQESYRFYEWDEATGEVRWMCSWDTTAEDVDGFVVAVAREMSASSPAAG
ncbi:MAG: threonine aldolase family protein [Candidatus Nanopelagicales bacterium]